MNYAGDISPEETWTALKDQPDAVLVDVRTRPEWNFVGLPDLSQIGKKTVQVEWQTYPTMDLNASFAQQIKDLGVEKDQPVYFLCRTGARSAAAADLMTAMGYTKCFNIAGGFEGPQDEKGHRGSLSGWKASGLPWKQP